jgi:hypothetical protein
MKPFDPRTTGGSAGKSFKIYANRSYNLVRISYISTHNLPGE